MGEYKFHFVLFGVCCAAGLCRTFRNGDYKSVLHCISVALVSGFLGLFTTSVVFKQPTREEYLFVIGVAGMIALAGRELTDGIVIRILKKAGLIDDNGASRKNQRYRR